MTNQPNDASELLVNFSRRGLWLAVAVLAVLGTYAVLINLFPDSAAAAMAERLFMLLPVALVLAIAVVRSSLKGASADPRAPAMKAVLNDELRQHSLSRAYRNGLFAVLFAQPLLAVLLTAAHAPYPVVLMASATALTGVAAVLCSMLAYDR